MMKSEFTERVGFEPTAEEYAEIEAEYMGTDLDKDQFCKEWKKNGGIQRLMRLRVRRIEELEREVKMKTKEYEDLDTLRCRQQLEMQKGYENKVKILEENLEILRNNQRIMEGKTREAEARADEAVRKLNIIREAVDILGLGKEV